MISVLSWFHQGSHLLFTNMMDSKATNYVFMAKKLGVIPDKLSTATIWEEKAKVISPTRPHLSLSLVNNMANLHMDIGYKLLLALNSHSP